MPIGSNQDAAENFGGGQGEALRRELQARYSPALRAAQLIPADEAKTAQLDLSKIKPEEGGEVIGAAVHGDSVIYVTVIGLRHYKGVMPLTSKHVAKGGSKQESTPEPEIEPEAEVEAEAEGEFGAESAEEFLQDEVEVEAEAEAAVWAEGASDEDAVAAPEAKPKPTPRRRSK